MDRMFQHGTTCWTGYICKTSGRHLVPGQPGAIKISSRGKKIDMPETPGFLV